MAENMGIAAKYQIPAELMAFVDGGFLEVVLETEKEMPKADGTLIFADRR